VWLEITMKKRGAFYYILPIFLLLVILTIGFFTSSWYLNKVVKVRLEKEFGKQTNGEYSLAIKSMGISIPRGSIVFRGLAIEPVNVPERDAAYTVTSSDIRFTGLNVLRFIAGKKIVVNSIELSDPSLMVVQGTSGMEQHTDTTAAFSLYNLIKEFAKSVNVKKLEVANSNVKLFSNRLDTIPSLSSNDNYFKIVNLYVGPSTDKISGLFTADSISLVMNRFDYTTGDSLYTFNVKRMEASYGDSTLTIDSIKVIPNYNKRRFAEIAGKQTDRFDVTAANVFFRKIDLRRFFEQHDLICPSLDITAFNMVAFRDRNDNREFNIPESLQQLLHDAPVYLRLDTIRLNKSFIAYEEIAPGKKEAGRLTFNDINANFTGLTNDSMLISMDRNLYFSAECNLMDKGKLVASYVFPLKVKEMVFECNGFLTEMPMSALNGMLGPSAGVVLNQGVIDTMDFNFTAGEKSSKGKMKLIYHDLKLEMPESGDKNVKLKDKISMFVANNLIIKESNPQKNKAPRIADMYYERNKQRFLFHYTWQTIFSGIKETVGMPDIKPKN
jgi:hypothetical protein